MHLPLHGSNPHYLYQSFQLDMPETLIDFSVNLNPLGPPASFKQRWPDWFDFISDYPDPEGNELSALIAENEGVSRPSILLGNGGSELITLIARMFSGKHIAIVEPTFSEYEKVSRANDCSISYIELPEGSWDLDPDAFLSTIDQADAVFVCHPNNPTGTVHSEASLLRLLEACAKRHCHLIVDEAFYDFLVAPRTLARFVDKSDYLIVLRSLTKMYSMAGLRLGYLLASEDTVTRLHDFQPFWSVNALALKAGEACFEETGYVQATHDTVHTERERMQEALRGMGYLISDSKVNFYLLRDPSLDEQTPLIPFLLKRGIVSRHTFNFLGLDGRWLRFAVRNRHANDILLEALKAWKQDH